MSKLSVQIFFSYTYISKYYSDRTILLPNCKALGETQAELHILRVQKWDVYIRYPFCEFGHKYTYIRTLYTCFKTAFCQNYPTVLVIKKRDLLKNGWVVFSMIFARRAVLMVGIIHAFYNFVINHIWKGTVLLFNFTPLMMQILRVQLWWTM